MLADLLTNYFTFANVNLFLCKLKKNNNKNDFENINSAVCLQYCFWKLTSCNNRASDKFWVQRKIRSSWRRQIQRRCSSGCFFSQKRQWAVIHMVNWWNFVHIACWRWQGSHISCRYHGPEYRRKFWARVKINDGSGTRTKSAEKWTFKKGKLNRAFLHFLPFLTIFQSVQSHFSYWFLVAKPRFQRSSSV